MLNLKYFKILFTSLGNLAGIGGGSLSMLVGLLVFFSSFLPFFPGLTLRVNLYAIFCLRLFLWLLAIRESYPEL